MKIFVHYPTALPSIYDPKSFNFPKTFPTKMKPSTFPRNRRLRSARSRYSVERSILGFHSREKKKKKMETFQYRKSRFWEMKEDKCTKSLAKNQVYAVVLMRDMWKNVLPKFIKLCMETPCLCPFQGHKYGRRKTTKTSVFGFSYLCVNSSFEELIKIKAIFILRQGMFR